MKYYVANFSISCPEGLMQDARDVLAAMLGEVGFETFEETEQGLAAYIQQALADEEAISQAVAGFPLPSTQIEYNIAEAEDRDWNEAWEQEGFEPIVVDQRLVIHDGRHLPAAMPQGIAIEIDAHLAFGTGNHETTRMICASLLDMNLQGLRVLDAGCGTGILGILAMKLGASSCLSYDIDEWSVDNTRHNAVINQVERLQPMHGDARLLDSLTEKFDLVLANINRNILLADMAQFEKRMNGGALLVLSGFYADDVPLLTERGSQLGLTLMAQRKDNGWACITLRKQG